MGEGDDETSFSYFDIAVITAATCKGVVVARQCVRVLVLFPFDSECYTLVSQRETSVGDDDNVQKTDYYRLSTIQRHRTWLPQFG